MINIFCVQNQNENISAYADESEDNILATFYSTNDVHGHIEKCYEYDKSKQLSYSNLAALKKDEKTFLVDAGDHTAGSAFAYFDWGQSLIDIMRATHYDFVVPGNHEFDCGVSNFEELILPRATSPESDEEKPFNYYSCNFFNYDPDKDEETQLAFGMEPYKIFEIGNNKKVALIGVSTPETIAKTSTGFFQDQTGRWLYKIDAADEMCAKVQTAVDDAKSKGADYCIAVSHLGIKDASEADNNTSKYLIEHTSGLNALIDGHSHTLIPREEKSKHHNDSGDSGVWKNKDGQDVKVVQTGSEFNAIGQIQIIDKGNDSVDFTNRLFYAGDENISERDNNVLIKEKSLVDKINNTYSDVLGRAEFNFYDYQDNDSSSYRYVRRHDTNLTDLATDSFYWYSNFVEDGADFSLINAGGIRGHINAGQRISVLDCFNVMPLNNQVCIATMPGSIIKEALEYAYKYYGLSSPDKGQLIETGALLHASGLQFKVDPQKLSSVDVDEEGVWKGPPVDGLYKVSDIKYYNKETEQYQDLDLNQEYKVCGITYLFTNFGDGFMMFRDDRIKTVNKDLSMHKILADYLNHFIDANTPHNFFSQYQRGDDTAINSKNSPLAIFPNFGICYENQFGANRIGSFQVNFDTYGGSDLRTQYIKPDGSVVVEPGSTEKEDFKFNTWCADASLENNFDFSTIINQDTTLYAKWDDASDSNLMTQFENGLASQTADLPTVLLVLIVIAFFAIITSLIIKRLKLDYEDFDDFDQDDPDLNDFEGFDLSNW